MSAVGDEHVIREIVAEQERAWNAGDARSYAMRFHADGTFTNVFGDRYLGRDAFRDRHAVIFETIAKGSKASLVVRRIHFPVLGTAIVDIDCEVQRQAMAPSGLAVSSNGAIRSSLLEVLVKEGDQWWIAGYHNVDVKPMPGRASS